MSHSGVFGDSDKVSKSDSAFRYPSPLHLLRSVYLSWQGGLASHCPHFLYLSVDIVCFHDDKYHICYMRISEFLSCSWPRPHNQLYTIIL